MLHLQLGSLYATQQKQAEAEAARQAVQADPQSIQPLLVLGDFFGQMKRRDEAAAAYKKAMALKPEAAAPARETRGARTTPAKLRRGADVCA